VTSSAHDVLLEAQSEDEWLAQVLEWARRGGFHGIHVIRSDRRIQGVQREDAWGWPDLVLIHPARRLIWLVELKVGRQPRLGRGQRQWHDTLRLAGATVYVWTPSMWREVKHLLLGSAEAA
jgi:hypothetical protein